LFTAAHANDVIISQASELQRAGKFQQAFSAISTQSANATMDSGVMGVVAHNIDATFSGAMINASFSNTSGDFISGAGGKVYTMNGPCVDSAGCGANGLFVSVEPPVIFLGTQAR